MSFIPGSLRLLNEAICTLTMRQYCNKAIVERDGGTKLSGGNPLKPKMVSTGN